MEVTALQPRQFSVSGLLCREQIVNSLFHFSCRQKKPVLFKISSSSANWTGAVLLCAPIESKYPRTLLQFFQRSWDGIHVLSFISSVTLRNKRERNRASHIYAATKPKTSVLYALNFLRHHRPFYDNTAVPRWNKQRHITVRRIPHISYCRYSKRKRTDFIFCMLWFPLRVTELCGSPSYKMYDEL